MVKLLTNHRYIDEAGSVIRIFFPGVKIVTDAGVSEPDLYKVVRHAGEASGSPQFTVISLLGDKEAYAEVLCGGDVKSGYAWPYEKTDGFLTLSRMLMLSLFFALQKVKPTNTPWGALTGIRPTKLVRQWLDAGIHENEAVIFLQDPYQVTEEKAKLALQVALTENRIRDVIYALGEKTAGFYINIPFCPTRCHYCSFTCVEKPPTEGFLEVYVNALVGEIREKLGEICRGGYTVSSIYIGGGTPTILTEGLLCKILTSLEDVLHGGLEFTVEGGRPDSVTEEKLKILKGHGVKRFSVNPQTLKDETLERIGRRHTVKDFYEAFALAKKIGFRCISSDIIAGLPGENMQDMENTVNGLLKLIPENITVHNLAIKRASKLKTRHQPMMEEGNMQTSRSMLALSLELLKNAGYVPYYLYRQKDMLGFGENVGYSMDGFWCLYNVGMMSEVQTVFGAGAGAVTKYVAGDRITRKFNVKSPELYVTKMGKNTI